MKRKQRIGPDGAKEQSKKFAAGFWTFIFERACILMQMLLFAFFSCCILQLTNNYSKEKLHRLILL